MNTQRRRILVVEDDYAIFDIAKFAMNSRGYEVVHASSAEEALASLKASDAEWAGVVTDINLGGRTGFQLIQDAVDAGFGAVPFVLITGEILDGLNAQRVNSLPMRTKPGVFIKPFSFTEVARYFDQRHCEVQAGTLEGQVRGQALKIGHP